MRETKAHFPNVLSDTEVEPTTGNVQGDSETHERTYQPLWVRYRYGIYIPEPRALSTAGGLHTRSLRPMTATYPSSRQSSGPTSWHIRNREPVMTIHSKNRNGVEPTTAEAKGNHETGFGLLQVVQTPLLGHHYLGDHTRFIQDTLHG